jgi:hypothetical protein
LVAYLVICNQSYIVEGRSTETIDECYLNNQFWHALWERFQVQQNINQIIICQNNRETLKSSCKIDKTLKDIQFNDNRKVRNSRLGDGIVLGM